MLFQPLVFISIETPIFLGSCPSRGAPPLAQFLITLKIKIFHGNTRPIKKRLTFCSAMVTLQYGEGSFRLDFNNHIVQFASDPVGR